MPKNPPRCVQCSVTESNLWRNLDLGIFCQECYEKNEAPNEPKTEEADGEQTKGKKTRNQRVKHLTSNATKGKGRRCIFKRHQPFKTSTVAATTSTKESVFHGGIYMQSGDIVSLQDAQGDTYYAQIRGFLVDTYLEKSAFLTWLIPSHLSPTPNSRFDPCTYLIGPDEDFPRKLDYMEFVMHAPSDYYKIANAPYTVKNKSDGETNFIWANLDYH